MYAVTQRGGALLGAEYPVACISESGQYVAVLVELPVNCCGVYVHIRMRVPHGLNAFGASQQT